MIRYRGRKPGICRKPNQMTPSSKYHFIFLLDGNDKSLVKRGDVYGTEPIFTFLVNVLFADDYLAPTSG